jgi:predicted nucleotidyltransferase
MRLTEEQQRSIKSVSSRIVGPDCRVWLFGSRSDDTGRGGDIDLLVETPRIVPDRVSTLCKLEGALVRVLGDRKLDILLKDARTDDALIFGVAKEKGVLL